MPRVRSAAPTLKLRKFDRVVVAIGAKVRLEENHRPRGAVDEHTVNGKHRSMHLHLKMIRNGLACGNRFYLLIFLPYSTGA